ncbi:hypothetical protein L1987_12729 [Smallanthus sonchifolius]|uniref:Uncharacterized protein n=1 Tax=Smallanthus sonchifolius TaxID=185202 RepID=A0ACB9JG40_9ASTR|nr:hypothetical protein L1987_12729 [Smallanthus sonchifolius]
MAPEKVTDMILNVDLKCTGCYKKVKKVICKIPQIRDQSFDMEKNKVWIRVVCCDPEKIRDKLCYKGCGAIQSIEIIEKPKEPAAKPAADKPKEAKPAADKPKEAKPAADKPKEAKPAADKPKEAKPAADKPKEAKPAADKPKEAKPAADKPKEPEKVKPAADKPKDSEKPKEPEKPKPTDKPKDSWKPPEPEKAKPKKADKPSPPKEPVKPDAGPNPDIAKMVYEPVHGYPQMYPLSTYPMVGYGQHYDHYYGGAPFEYGYGTPVASPPPPSYGGFGYGNEYYGYNGKSHYASNDNEGEEDGEGCSIM